MAEVATKEATRDELKAVVDRMEKDLKKLELAKNEAEEKFNAEGGWENENNQFREEFRSAETAYHSANDTYHVKNNQYHTVKNEIEETIHEQQRRAGL